MKGIYYQKRLSAELLERIGYDTTPERIRRMMFLLNAFELQEHDPSSYVYITGQCKMGIDARAMNVVCK